MYTRPQDSISPPKPKGYRHQQGWQEIRGKALSPLDQTHIQLLPNILLQSLASSTALQLLCHLTTALGLSYHLRPPPEALHVASHPCHHPTLPRTHQYRRQTPIPIRCSSSNTGNAPSQTQPVDDPENFPTLSSESQTTTQAENFPIERRRRSEIVRDRKSRTGLVKPEPPNFEIGWKRTKPIQVEKPVGFVIMDFLDKLEGLMGRQFGSTELLAKAGEVVAERVREEAEDLRDEGKVEDRMVTELFRVLKLMEMDLAMVKAAVKDETLNERLEQAKARCRQAILVAKSF